METAGPLSAWIWELNELKPKPEQPEAAHAGQAGGGDTLARARGRRLGVREEGGSRGAAGPGRRPASA